MGMNKILKAVTKNLLFFVSVSLNVLVVLFFIFASKARPAYLEHFTLGVFSRQFLHTALVVSVPEGGADVSFGPVGFSLKRGGRAALQVSYIYGGKKQANLAIQPLYDRSVVSCEPTGYGLAITALAAGETALQVFSPSLAAFSDLAYITVYE